MSNFVEQIVESMESIIGTTLGATYKKLSYKFNVEQNDFVRNKKRYGVVPLDAESAITAMRYYTINHTFQVILIDDYKNVGGNDKKQEQVLFSLYDKLDDITENLYNKKLGISNIVYYVTLSSKEEPEFIEEDNVIALRANYVVQYRKQI